MYIEKNQGDTVTVTMSHSEAQVLSNALAIATIHVGPDVVAGPIGRGAGIDPDYMRGMFDGAVGE